MRAREEVLPLGCFGVISTELTERYQNRRSCAWPIQMMGEKRTREVEGERHERRRGETTRR